MLNMCRSDTYPRVVQCRNVRLAVSVVVVVNSLTVNSGETMHYMERWSRESWWVAKSDFSLPVESSAAHPPYPAGKDRFKKRVKRNFQPRLLLVPLSLSAMVNYVMPFNTVCWNTHSDQLLSPRWGCFPSLSHELTQTESHIPEWVARSSEFWMFPSWVPFPPGWPSFSQPLTLL